MIKRITVFFLSALLIILATAVLLPSVSAAVAYEKNPDGFYYSAAKGGTTGLTKAPGVTCRGVDISKHNGAVDWNKLYEQYQAGTLSFVIIRCGYGSDIESQDDEYWKTNADACTRLGIPFGVYLYSYANTLEKAHSEAAHVLRLIEGYTPTYPIYYDVEDTKTQGKLGGDFFVNICDIFCGTMQEHGYETGIYSMRSWMADNNYLGRVDCENKNYSRWVAEFNSTLKYTKEYDIWQCTSEGVLDGITVPASAAYPKGRCDINFSYIPVRTVDHCYLTFDMNGIAGNTPDPVHVNRGSKFGTLPVATSEDGKSFLGWYTEPAGGELVTAESTVTANGKLKLYAHWSSAFGLTAGNATISGGTAIQEVTAAIPFAPITVTANSGYYLPEHFGLPEGLSWSRTSRTTATITGSPVNDATILIDAIPDNIPEPPQVSLMQTPVSAAGLSDGIVSGVSADMEICLAGNSWRAVTASEAASGITGLPAGEIKIRYAATASSAASAYVSYIVKARAPKPDDEDITTFQPSLLITANAIGFNSENLEYSTDGGISYIATGIGSRNGFDDWSKILIRRAADEVFAESEPLTVELCQFNNEQYLDYPNEMLLTNTPLSEFLINGEAHTSDESGKIKLTEAMFGATLTIELAANKDKPISVICDATIPARPAIPDITVTNETYSGQGNGSIAGLTTKMQYSIDNGESWKNVVSKMTKEDYTDFEYDTEYLFRFKPVTAESAPSFASESFSAIIKSGRMLKVTFVAEGCEDTVIEVAYNGTIETPVLPVREDSDMEASNWDTLLDGVQITEDITVTAKYVKLRKCGSCSSGGTALLLLSTMCCGIIPFTIKKKH